MKLPKTPARQEDTAGLSSFITCPHSQRSFIFNLEQSSQEELGSCALFPVIYNACQLCSHGKLLCTSQQAAPSCPTALPALGKRHCEATHRTKLIHFYQLIAKRTTEELLFCLE